jgi:hypothetical protein
MLVKTVLVQWSGFDTLSDINIISWMLGIIKFQNSHDITPAGLLIIIKGFIEFNFIHMYNIERQMEAVLIYKTTFYVFYKEK